MRPFQDFGGPADERTAEKLIGYETGDQIGESLLAPLGLGGVGKRAGRAVGTIIGAYARPFQEAAEEAQRQVRQALGKALTTSPREELIRALRARSNYVIPPNLSQAWHWWREL
jgi:hypothetical protein